MVRTLPSSHDSRLKTRDSAHGLTLIEMLISMAVTLLMMAAVVNLFANVGAGVRNRRASMELGGQLRLARARLFKDLAGATCAARPKLPSDDHDDGYLEIIDGLWSDSNPSILLDGIDDGPGTGFRNREIDYATSLVPSGGDPAIVVPSTSSRVPTTSDITNGGGLGDHDCILALTVRSESEPFLGRWVNPATNLVETVRSDLAEVIWYLVENPADGSLGEPGMRTLYRRVLLIAPWLQLPELSIYGGTTNENILAYYRNNDISAQIYTVNNANGNIAPNNTTVLVPNTLSDLTKRENRFAHSVGIDGSALSWPYIMDQQVIRLLPFDADEVPPRPEMVSPLRPFGYPFEPSGVEPDRKGEDVILNDVLAFDLRVYDPGAPLVSINNGPILEPSDAAWNPSNSGATIVGFGSFVSLGWDQSFSGGPPRYNYNYANPPTGVPGPLFKEPHTPGWHPQDPTNTNSGYNYWATYDTWPYHYEDDGINQDNGLAAWRAGIDQGTDGLDSDGNNGVDDTFERETFPPYDTPLRAMQVKIRVYERDTRQIREATVTRNFVPQ